MGDDHSVSGSSESDESYDSDSSSSDVDSYSHAAAAAPAFLQIPSLSGLGALPPVADMAEGGDGDAASATKQRSGTPGAAGLSAGEVSPSDVPLSALTLGGRSTANGLAGAARLDLSEAATPDLSARSPGGGRSHRSDGGARTHRSGRHSARAPALMLDVVSPAFGLDKEALRLGEASGVGPAEVARRRASSGLGVPAAALRMYELREVPPGAELASDSQRIAFAISDSSFSLSAIEESMAENKRLMATNSHTSQALETLQQLVKEQNSALAKLKVQAGEQVANARRLQERYDVAERFGTMLRQQLERSENLRVQGQQALAELKMEFEALTSELMAEGHVTPGAQSPRLLPQAAAAHQANHRALPARPDAAGHGALALLEGQQGSRLTALLERFSDETVLSRLEQVLEKAATSK